MIKHGIHTKVLLCLLLVAVLLSCLPGCGDSESTGKETDPVKLASQDYEELSFFELEDDELTGMSIVTENDNYALYLDFSTTAFALVDKQKGQAFYSDPFKTAGDVVIGEEERNKLSSNLVLTYNDKKSTEYTYTSSADSVAHGQFTVLKLENGVRIVYTLGKDESQDVYPPVLDIETFERIYNQLTETEQGRLESYYTLYKSEEVKNGTAVHPDLTELVQTYPALNERDLYVLGSIGAYQRRQLKAILDKVEFTFEETVEQMNAAGYQYEDTSVMFTVPLDLTLDENGLQASVDTSLISETEGYALHKVALLYGFGASTTAGSIYLPDGSGAEITTPNNRLDLYSQRLYGEDGALSDGRQAGEIQQAVLPFIALSTQSGSMLATVESGAAMAFACARPATEMNPLAIAYMECIVRDTDYRESDELVLEAGKLLLNARSLSNTKLTVRYDVAKEQRSYSELAVSYREHLVKTGKLQKQESDYPFLLDLYGALDRKETVFGISVSRMEPLTTFAEAEELIGLLQTEGVQDIKVRYLGIANGGITNSLFDRMEIEKALGGLDGYQKLLENTDGVTVYPNAETQMLYTDGTFDGFSPSQDAARYINGQNAYRLKKNPATLLRAAEPSYYLLSPNSFMEYTSKLLQDMQNKKLNTVSFSSLGGMLNSDFNRAEYVSREEAAGKAEEALKAFKEKDFSIMVDTGNLYALPYADTVVGLPASGSGQYMQARQIPFVQIVLHGYVEYGMTAFNTVGGSQSEFLRAMETGGLVYYSWMWADNVVLKNTDFESAYALHYGDWIEEAIEQYQTLAAVMKPLANETITSHRYLNEQVTETVYESGTAVYVNTGSADYTDGGLTVPAEGYTVGKGGN